MADTPHPSSIAGGPYDGVTFPYIPKAALDIDPKNPNVWYVASASGGLFKTENRGNTFTSIFDEGGSFSLGAVKVSVQSLLVEYRNLLTTARDLLTSAQQSAEVATSARSWSIGMWSASPMKAWKMQGSRTFIGPDKTVTVDELREALEQSPAVAT